MYVTFECSRCSGSAVDILGMLIVKFQICSTAAAHSLALGQRLQCMHRSVQLYKDLERHNSGDRDIKEPQYGVRLRKGFPTQGVARCGFTIESAPQLETYHAVMYNFFCPVSK